MILFLDKTILSKTWEKERNLLRPVTHLMSIQLSILFFSAIFASAFQTDLSRATKTCRRPKTILLCR